jgi:hypothetical protein
MSFLYQFAVAKEGRRRYVQPFCRNNGLVTIKNGAGLLLEVFLTYPQ